MENTYWQKQTLNKTLFPDLLWSRPEHKKQAGKLLIVGGNLHGFAAPAEAFNYAFVAGIGTSRVILPDSIKKLVGSMFENGEFVPSTPSGSFSQKALSDLLEHASWADGVLLAGDFGRNSETAILIEKFMDKFAGQITFTKDAADYAISSPGATLEREDTLLILSMAQLQKLGIGIRFKTAFTLNMDLLRLVDTLHIFTSQYSTSVITKHMDQVVVASKGRVSTTKFAADLSPWRIKTAAYASVWWLQNPSKPFETITTAVHESISGAGGGT